ncbi:MAG: PQQ-like beta-propeller repeat protein, partial [Planctomycetaceae bacterium]|nr:PQQ-like beta-propeller repeat protein [Planctomycetaceae bacterium]
LILPSFRFASFRLLLGEMNKSRNGASRNDGLDTKLVDGLIREKTLNLTMKHFIIALFFSFGISVTIYAQGNWPIFHGPNGDNKSPETGLLQSWPEGGPKLLWTVDFLGSGYSGVSIADGRIYISGNDQENEQSVAMLYCLDEKTGKLLWKSSNGPAWDNPRQYPSTRATVTIDGDFVYDESAHGEVGCFEAKTGKKIWSRNIAKEYETRMPMWGLAESVAIDGDRLICSPGGTKASVVALDRKTGKTVWEAEPHGFRPSYATPYFFTFEGRRIVAILTDKTVMGLDPKDGTILFTFPHTNKLTTNVTMPIYHDGHLFMSTGYGEGARLWKLAKDSSGKIMPEEVWYEKTFDNHHGGIILVGDTVYGTTHNGGGGVWIAVDFQTGKVGYTQRNVGQGSIHYADGLIYGLSEKNRTVILLKPDPKEYVERGRFQLPNDADGMSWAHPVVSGGRLYLRHAQFLYCYDVKE